MSEVSQYRSDAEIQAFENPPIGTIVHWYPQANRANKDGVIAAFVTGHEGPGMVSLTCFGRLANARYICGVRHMTDPFHRRKSAQTMTSGGWEFIPPYQEPARADTVSEAKKVLSRGSSSKESSKDTASV